LHSTLSQLEPVRASSARCGLGYSIAWYSACFWCRIVHLGGTNKIITLHIWTQKNMPNKAWYFYIWKSKKKFLAFSSLVGLVGSMSSQTGFLQTTSDLQRQLTTCSSIRAKLILKILSFNFKYWPSYDFFNYRKVRSKLWNVCWFMSLVSNACILRPIHEGEGWSFQILITLPFWFQKCYCLYCCSIRLYTEKFPNVTYAGLCHFLTSELTPITHDNEATKDALYISTPLDWATK